MPLAPDIVGGVARRLVEHAGLELPAWVVEARVSARIAALDIAPAAYVELIGTARGAAELRELLEAVRVGESSLFRHRPQIAALTDVVVPALRERGRRAVRVWSAGCASGEEPYTLAIILSRRLPGVSISITATDVSDDALAVAARGVYPRNELDDVPEEWRDAFLDEGDTVRVRPEIAQLVTFSRANLLEAAPPRNCDVVWCRNVLIYFSAAARLKVIERLVAATVPTGYIFVGYSESLREITDLETQRASDAVFYTKRGDWPVGERTPLPEPLGGRVSTSIGLAPLRADQLPRPTAKREPASSVAREERTDVGLTPAPARTATRLGTSSVPEQRDESTAVGITPAPAPAPARTATRLGTSSIPAQRDESTAVGIVPAPVRTATRLGTSSVPAPRDESTAVGITPAPAPARTATRLGTSSVPAQRDEQPTTPTRRAPTNPGIATATDEATAVGVAPPRPDPSAPRRTAATPAVSGLRSRNPTAPGAVSAHTVRRENTSPGLAVAVAAAAAPDESVLALVGAPSTAEVTALLGERLAIAGLKRLTLDLDAVVMLEDDLAPVIRRACAAARQSGIAIEIRATKTGAKRWVSRHALDEATT